MPEHRARLLVVAGDSSLRRHIVSSLAARCEIVQGGALDEVLARARGGDIDLALIEMRPHSGVPQEDPWARAVAEIHRSFPRALVIALLDEGDREGAPRACDAGAYEAHSASAPLRELELAVSRALERRRLEDETRRLREQLARCFDPQGLPGISPAMQAVRKAIGAAAPSDVPIQVRGERGTGKEQVARVVHALSRRHDYAFFGCDCSALPGHLLEEELFGPDKEIRAGVSPAREGRILSTDGGTLFLDEIGSLDHPAQARLMRILETGELEGRTGTRVNIRLVAGTSVNLGREAREGRFRQDLLRRLSVVAIELPPLRERREDIPVLAERFLERHCRENNLHRRHLSQEALDCLIAHPWKGNVRELDHLIESLVLTSEGTVITARMLPKALRELTPAGALAGVAIPDSGLLLHQHVAEFERALLASALERTGGRKKEAAKVLGLNKDQLKYLCRKYNL